MWFHGVWKCPCGSGGDGECGAEKPALCQSCTKGQQALGWPSCHHGAQCQRVQEPGVPGLRRIQKNPTKTPKPTSNSSCSREKISTFLENLPLYLRGENSPLAGFLMLPQTEGLTLMSIFAFPKERKLFSCSGWGWGGIFAPGGVLKQPEPSGKGSTHHLPKICTRFLAQPLLPVLLAAKPPQNVTFSIFFSSLRKEAGRRRGERSRRRRGRGEPGVQTNILFIELHMNFSISQRKRLAVCNISQKPH